MKTQSARNNNSIFTKTALLSLIVISAFTLIGFYSLYNNFGHWSVKLFVIPLVPGMLVYILLTGDVHFGQEVEGIIVTGLGAWVFWTFLIYLVIVKIKKYKEEKS